MVNSPSRPCEPRPAELSAAGTEERASQTEISESIAALTHHPLLRAILDAVDVSVMVLNRQRQILVGNTTLLDACLRDELGLIQSLRPGEALSCVHAQEGPDGCGSAPECTVCGAALAIAASRHTSRRVERECLMTVQRGTVREAAEMYVCASQVEIDGETYTVVGLRDVSAEKRREALERVFLHDVSNTVGPLLLSATVLADRVGEPDRETADRVLRLAETLRRDIEGQRILLAAETGTLKVVRAAVKAQEVLQAAAAVLNGAAEARNRTVEILDPTVPITVVTDESLLVRILVNMLKNALEATPKGGTVRAWVEAQGTGCELRVWNAAALTPATALQLFKRSFTTKGDRGRGLGTFSIKLLGERYLGGTVGFTSTAAEGTTFFLRLPG